MSTALTMGQTLVIDDTDLIAELASLTDTCLKGARMERDAGLRIGELLTKKRGDPKKNWGFQKWVKDNCRFSMVHANRYMAAWKTFRTLGSETADWTLTELAQGKKYEPKPEAEFDIKVATTEHPVVVSDTRNDPKPVKRPPCPGAEGIGPGCWKWSEGMEEWVQQPAYVEPKSNKLTAEDIAAHEARVKANQAKHQATFDSFSSSLKSLLNQTQQHMPAAILDDASPIEYLTQAFATMLQYGGAPAAKLAKQMFSSAYHPDSGKVRHDASLMGSINKALSFLEK